MSMGIVREHDTRGGKERKREKEEAVRAGRRVLGTIGRIRLVSCVEHEGKKDSIERLYETRDPFLLTSRHHGHSRGRGGLCGHPVVECRRILFQYIYLRLIVQRRGKWEREMKWDPCPDQRKRCEHRTRRVAWETNRE